MSKRRVVILGGGCAGVAAALQLTRTAELREKFDVTIYAQGWRLGGKGASGRASSPDRRVEEHGLHLWMGWYFTAFRVMREVFDEWQPPAGSPFRDCASAFAPMWDITLIERHKGALLPWTIRLPPMPGQPWQGVIPSDSEASAPGFGRDLASWLKALAFDSESGLPSLFTHPATSARRALLSVRLAAVLFKGWNRDVRPYGEAGYARIDHLDLRAWLVLHGASGVEVIDAPAIRALYDLAFAPEGGLAAGAALRTMIHVATAYRGAPFFRMPYSMGDTVFSPALDVLRARGARVELMHRASRLRLSNDRRTIASIDMIRQARVRGGGALDGRIDVKGQRAWLAEAPWDTLEDGSSLRAAGARFESASWTGGEPFTLERGRDFDDMVLAIPAPACPDIVTELTAHLEPWRVMLESQATTATRAVQLWLDRPAEASGRVTVGLAHSFSARADMSDVLAAECWEDVGRRPQSLVYLCDAIGDSERTAEGMEQFVAGASVVSSMTRENVEGSDRYVLSRPGSAQHRLGAAESGVGNLFLAGDWVRTSINGGSVEAAFESGVAAADALAARS